MQNLEAKYLRIVLLVCVEVKHTSKILIFQNELTIQQKKNKYIWVYAMTIKINKTKQNKTKQVKLLSLTLSV